MRMSTGEGRTLSLKFFLRTQSCLSVSRHLDLLGSLQVSSHVAMESMVSF